MAVSEGMREGIGGYTGFTWRSQPNSGIMGVRSTQL